MSAKAPIMLAAGGTGGHLFPAEALASVLTGVVMMLCWLLMSGCCNTARNLRQTMSS